MLLNSYLDYFVWINSTITNQAFLLGCTWTVQLSNRIIRKRNSAHAYRNRFVIEWNSNQRHPPKWSSSTERNWSAHHKWAGGENWRWSGWLASKEMRWDQRGPDAQHGERICTDQEITEPETQSPNQWTACPSDVLSALLSQVHHSVRIVSQHITATGSQSPETAGRIDHPEGLSEQICLLRNT